MSAIVTEQFRRNSAKSLLADIANTSTNYYIGLGKSDKWVNDEQLTNWTVPSPTGTAGESAEIKSNLISLLKAETALSQLVIPRITFKSGARYKQYTPYDENCFYPETISGVTYLPCYVVTTVGSNIAIYLCLRSATTAAITPPSDTTSYIPRTYGDDYVWSLVDIFSIGNAAINTDQYVSITSGVVPSNQANPIAVSSGGILYGFTVLSGGSDYDGTLSVQFTPYTSSATLSSIQCTPVIEGGEIVALYLPNDYIYSAGIVNGTFSFTNNAAGVDATIVPNITPLTGLAYEPSSVLPAWFIGISVSAVEDLSGDGFYIPYRQISILRGVSHSQSGNPSTLGALKYVTLSGAEAGLASIQPGQSVVFNNDSIAWFDSYAVVDVDGTPQYRVYYHQNSTSGYGKIPDSGNVTISTYSSLPFTQNLNNEYTPDSGELIFIENRKPIIRAQSQTEEIKIIIQL